MEPGAALDDFKKRGLFNFRSLYSNLHSQFSFAVKMYEQTYVSLGEYEEDQGMAYIKVGENNSTNYILGFIAYTKLL